MSNTPPPPPATPAPALDPAFEPLDVLPAEEGSCLLRSYALHKIRKDPKEVVILHYSQDPQRSIDGRFDTCGEKATVPEGGLYAPGPPITINEKYAHTWPRKSSRIWVMDRVGCDIKEAKKFIKAVVGEIPPAVGGSEAVKPEKVLEAKSLDRFGNFITGVSLRASYVPEFFTIFVSLPYLGVGYNATLDESRTLSQYRLQQQPTNLNPPIDNNRTPTILVHQTWLLNFHDERIGIFRSKDDYYYDRAPLFPYQKRMATSQALVHMISNLLTSSEKEALNMFKSEVHALERKTEASEGDTLGDERSTAIKHELFKSYGTYIKDASTMMRIVRTQISHLKDLRQIFESSHDSEILTGEPRPHRNSYPIPLLRPQPEQLEDVVNSITAVVAERERFYKELRILLKDIKVARTLCLDDRQTDTLQAQTTSQVALEKTLDKQAQSQKAIEETLKSQGQTITLFTLITTVFLPLGFFCSYYAVPENLKGAIFWLIAGPFTAGLTALLAVFWVYSDERIKETFAKWWRIFFFNSLIKWWKTLRSKEGNDVENQRSSG